MKWISGGGEGDHTLVDISLEHDRKWFLMPIDMEI